MNQKKVLKEQATANLNSVVTIHCMKVILIYIQPVFLFTQLINIASFYSRLKTGNDTILRICFLFNLLTYLKCFELY